jgi:hypothetical protein
VCAWGQCPFVGTEPSHNHPHQFLVSRVSGIIDNENID